MLGVASLLMLAAPAVAEACPICFRDPESPMTAGVMAGVGTLLSITAAVLGGFGVLIRRIARAEMTSPSATMTLRPSAKREGGQ